MFRRSIPTALRPAGSLSASAASRTARSFSCTPARGVNAIFTETENPELNNLLAIIQEKIILPAHLPQKQRKVIFDPKRRQHLQQNPIVIEIEGHEHKFTTIDRFKDIPNSKKVFYQAVRNMRAPEDFQNLGTLLRGFHKADIHLRPRHYAQAIDHAGKNGHVNVMVECAKQSSKTGLTLQDPVPSAQLLMYINDKVVDTNFEDAEVAARAYSLANTVFDLLQRPEHQAKSSTIKPHHRPLIRGLLLFSQASAVHIRPVADEAAAEESVSESTELRALKANVEGLIAYWTRHDLASSEAWADVFNPLKNKATETVTVLSATAYVRVLTQNIKGMGLAREILGESAADLQPVEEALQKELTAFVHSAREKWPKSQDYWAAEYEKIMGRKPTW